MAPVCTHDWLVPDDRVSTATDGRVGMYPGLKCDEKSPFITSSAKRYIILKLFFKVVAYRFPFLVCYTLLESSCDQVSMETNRVISARLMNFDITPISTLPWQP